MALKAATFPLTISATQGAADAFVQGSVLTGLTGRQAYNIRTLELEIATANSFAVDQSEIEVSLSRRSKTAIPTIADPDVIWRWRYQARAAGAAYLTVYTKVFSVIFPVDFELPVVEETLYMQLDSTLSGFTNTAIVRMGVELDTMSDIDRLNLIARSLT